MTAWHPSKCLPLGYHGAVLSLSNLKFSVADVYIVSHPPEALQCLVDEAFVSVDLQNGELGVLMCL